MNTIMAIRHKCVPANVVIYFHFENNTSLIFNINITNLYAQSLFLG